MAASMRLISAMSSPRPTITLYLSLSKKCALDTFGHKAAPQRAAIIPMIGRSNCGSMPFFEIEEITSARENTYEEICICGAQTASDKASVSELKVPHAPVALG